MASTLTAVLETAAHGHEWPSALAALLDGPIPQRHIALRSDRAFTPGDVATLGSLRDRAQTHGITVSAECVLDDDADAIAWLGGAPTSLAAVVDATRALRQQGIAVRWWIPLSPVLVYRLEALYSLARAEAADPVLTPTGADAPVAQGRAALTTEDDLLFAADFVAYRLLDQEQALLSATRRGAYAALLQRLRAGGPNGEADGVSIPPDDGAGPGEARDGGRIRQQIAHAADVVGVLSDGVRGLLQWGRSKTPLGRRARPPLQAGDPLPRLMLIGAYGGDHIGDTAILGGVLLRMHARHGSTHAVLMSQRPEHTRHLVAMLETPVQVTVAPYVASEVAATLSQVDGVVFAGGPLMDLPKQLVLHLHTVSLARHRGIPFLVEGIGAGPFVRRASEWIARRLLEMADRIVVRTSSDAAAPLMAGLRPETGRDPAFDYLATRGATLTKRSAADDQWHDRLLRGTAGRMIVGVNIRPIRHEWTAGAEAGKQAEYTRMIAERFEQRLAEAMRRVHASAPRPVTFLFFPMNAIQFGMSDLRSAFRIKQLLGAEADFRVWEGGATLDGVIGILRTMDAVITMRFHAAVFALSQQRRVIGIDYRIGKSYKVTALLRDAGRGDDCCRIDEMTVEWLSERLMAAAGTPPAQSATIL